jgi:aspartyl-tRNA(Asn)/glutamyl-tRNA(Gln) amidotransferase subunit A
MTTDLPWDGDACSLVEAFRTGERKPVDELDATLAAIERSTLNAFCHLDVEAARATATGADVRLPFGGVPVAVKALDAVAGWPADEGCVALEDERYDHDSTMVSRLRHAGAVLFGQTTASEFGGVNVTRTVLRGVTRNPWNPERTPGGSSGGSAAAVAGGLCSIATGGDGGGSIRIPAGFTGLFGLKPTYGRIPRGPRLEYGNLTSTVGCLSRSVRDAARWFDVTNGHEPRDPLSLPAVDGWEAGLGTHRDELRGMRVVVVDDWGGAVVGPSSLSVINEAAEALIAAAGLRRVDGVDTSLPDVGSTWSISGMLGTFGALGDRWPDCKDVLTREIRAGMERAEERYSIATRVKIERRRMELNERMAALFEQVDLVIAAANPDVAFAAEGPLPKTFDGIEAGRGNNGRLTFPANLFGCPAVSIPAGQVDGLPVGLQITSRHFTEPVLLELAAIVEAERPWPLVAPRPPG